MTANLHLVASNPTIRQSEDSLEERVAAIERAGGLEAVASTLPEATTIFHEDGTQTVTPWLPVQVVFCPS